MRGRGSQGTTEVRVYRRGEEKSFRQAGMLGTGGQGDTAAFRSASEGWSEQMLQRL